MKNKRILREIKTAGGLGPFISLIKKEAIDASMRVTGGNSAAASKMIGIKRTTFLHDRFALFGKDNQWSNKRKPREINL